MIDLLVLGITLASAAATYGLIVLCERLVPGTREARR
jgi:hypothetical protein